jgi:hypothetical protein
MKISGKNRRTLIAGMVGAIGSALCAKTAYAFRSETQGLVQAGTRILQKFGVSVTEASDTRSGRDVLRFTIDPHDDIRYEQLVNGPGTFAPCWLTSSFGDAVEFTNFDMTTSQPNVRIASEDGQSLIEILDSRARVQVKIAGGATYELRDGVLVRVGE